MAKNGSTKTQSSSESNKLIIIVIIASVIIVSSVIFIKFNDPAGFFRPPGVGAINSEHVHGKIKLYHIESIVQLDPKKYPQYEKANDYIFFDRNKNVHRVAAGATLGLFFEGLGMQYTDDCLIFLEDVFRPNGTRIEKGEYCEDDEMTIRVLVNYQIIPEKSDFVIQEADRVMVMYAAKYKLVEFEH